MDEQDQQWRDAVAATVFFIVACVLCSAGVFFLILGIVQLSSG